MLGSASAMGLFDRLKKKGAEHDDAEVAGLVGRLRDPDWQVRKSAAEALGALGTRAASAVPALEEAIADDHGEVCLAASDALSRIRIASD